MSTWPLALAGILTRTWVNAYTTGLPKLSGGERREEIASDLWEQATGAGLEGQSPGVAAAHIFGRTFLGMPADVAWHLGELKGEEMEMSIGEKSVVGVFAVLGIATVVFGVLLGSNGIVDGWLNDSPLDFFYGVLILASIIGQFVAVAGVYAWRRADSEGRSTKKARSMIVVGTLGIAVLGG